jgi:nitrile hydratase
VVDGIHDMGGMAGFGPVVRDEQSFHADWERRVFALNLLSGLANIDAGRHAIERLDPVSYLTAGYFGRWLGALELIVRENDATIAPTAPTSLREIERPPRFGTGDRVCARRQPSPGHTRLPRYARGQVGTVAIVHPPFVLPDTNAHGRGEHPEHVYAVRFDARELFGETAEPGTTLHVDLFESYLEPAP